LITQRAKVYVGRSPYRWGGASPSGFDCSGFAMYVYRRAGMRSLPHNAQAQRDSSRMRRISRGAARPGDLVFYLSGGYAYHVAVYAGRGKQYAATEPGQKIRYQKTPRGVVFGTDWH
jgi:cell wall-associated NlpC family hydrolase